MKKWTIAGILLVFLVSIGAVACSPSGGGAAKAGQQVEVTLGDLTVTVNGSGNIEISDEREITFGTAGRIDKIFFDEGDRVYKGDVLAKLNTSALELAVLKAEDALETAKRTLKDTKDPYDEVDKAVAASTLAAAEAGLSGAYEAWAIDQTSTAKKSAVKSAEATLERAQETWDEIIEGFDAEDVADAERQVAIAQATLDDAKRQLVEATIFAPFNGIVADVEADEGDSVMSLTTIVHLIDPNSKELKLEVDEIDMPGVKLGQRAIIEVDALPDTQFEGEVTYIYPLSIETFGVVVYEVTIDLDVPEGYELLDGMSASADIVISERNSVLLVPSQAIGQDSQGNSVVQIVVEEQIEDRPVVTGITDGDKTEVVEGLEEGEIVVEKR